MSISDHISSDTPKILQRNVLVIAIRSFIATLVEDTGSHRRGRTLAKNATLDRVRKAPAHERNFLADIGVEVGF